MAYASFGSDQSATYLHTAQDCYDAGQVWALAGNLKLPKEATVRAKEYRITKSATVHARAFVAGWKAGKEETKKESK